MVDLADLVAEGWEDSKHRLYDFKILVKGTDRILYDPKKEVIFKIYKVREIQDPTTYNLKMKGGIIQNG